MSLAIQIGTIIVVSLSVGGLCALWWALPRVKALEESNDSHVRALKVRGEANDELKSIIASRTDQASLLEDLTRQLERTTRERSDFARRADEYRRSIEGILKERDTVWALYDDQAVAHGNAQVLMMSGIAFLHRKLAELGHHIEMPSIIRETHEQYVTEHVNPVLARTGTQRARQDIPGPTGSAEST